MKTVIAALNTKFVHMSLAPWYLKAACTDTSEIKVLELTINQEKSEILRRLYMEKPDVLAFSCYIFNINQIEAIVKDIRIIFPNITLILGGPEVSFDTLDFMKHNPDVDYIICGEGEERFRRLLRAISGGTSPSEIDGIAYREGNIIKLNPPLADTLKLDEIPSPYTDEMLSAAAGKIVYFEASRGCPFRCSYCLSSTSGSVRRFTPERIKIDLLRLMHSDARQIKFVDRTFNCSLPRAKEIVRFILETAKHDEKAAGKNYHFEAAADLFDDELIDILSSAPVGLFQLEIGIQSFNEKTLEAVDRKTNLEVCGRNINKLIKAGNMHIHLDLIAGLPYEDFSSFANSFNNIYKLRPHCIQLGFLKLLRGSKMRDSAGEYGYTYSSMPPYEVFSTPWISYVEILRLKTIETAVDALYNSGRFNLSLNYIIGRFTNSFTFFEKFSCYLAEFYPDGYGVPSRELYNLLLQFAKNNLIEEKSAAFEELLKFDFFVSDSSCNPPKSINRHEIKNARSLYTAERGNKSRVHFELFNIDPLYYRDTQQILHNNIILRFGYGSKNRVTGHYTVQKI